MHKDAICLIRTKSGHSSRQKGIGAEFLYAVEAKLVSSSN